MSADESLIVHLWHPSEDGHGELSTLTTRNLRFALIVKALIAVLDGECKAEIRRLRVRSQQPSDIAEIDPKMLLDVNVWLDRKGFPKLES